MIYFRKVFYIFYFSPSKKLFEEDTIPLIKKIETNYRKYSNKSQIWLPETYVQRHFQDEEFGVNSEKLMSKINFSQVKEFKKLRTS